MEIFLQILLLLAGLALIVFGADYLVEGASDIARRYGLSEFVIGLTIVGMGTSAPEMVVSVIGAIGGNADVAIGNVLGSNIFNTLLILGLTAIILPIGITESNRRMDIPIGLLATLVFVFLGFSYSIFHLGENGLNRIDGIVLLTLFVIYMWLSLRGGRKGNEADDVAAPTRPVWLCLLLVAGSLAALIFGGRLFVNSATHIARMAGVSDKFIAVTVLAGGTSFPELATCIAAAIKKKGQLALGNIVGSNVFNLLLIVGCAAVINPLSFADINVVDAAVLILSSVLLLFCGRKFGRVWGSIFVALFISYFAYLIIQL